MLKEELLKDVDFRRLVDEEKKARLDNEAMKGAHLCVEIVKYIYEKKDYESLRAMMISLNKKRSQSREAVTHIVKYALNDIYPTLDEEEGIRLLNTLIEITEGRIFVEFEYSVIIRKLTEIQLKRGNIDEAAKLVQDIQIETFGSLERAYKVEYILFQMKILLKKEDYIRVLIVSNKVNRRHLNEEGLEKLKMEFFELMIKYYIHEEKFLEVSKAYKTLYDFLKEIEVKISKKEENKNIDNLKEIISQANKEFYFVNYVMYLTICPPILETKNMLNELNLSYKKDLDETPDMLFIVKKRLSDDIVYVDNSFLSRFSAFPIFDKNNTENSEKHAQYFRKYLIAHNLIIFEKYFSSISLKRIGEMIGTSLQEVEAELADMVIHNYLYAKINRIQSTVNFKKKQETGDKLDDLNYDLSRMLEKLENTCHLIHKENLKYEIK